MPITIRVPVGGGIGSAEHHSESPEAYFTHTPGLRVVSVSNPQDAYDAPHAIACDDPVLFFEPKRRYHMKAAVERAQPASAAMGTARVLRPGTDVTLVTFGGLVQVALPPPTRQRTRACRSR